MNTYNNISSELKSYLAGKPIFKVLLPIDMVFLFGGLIIMLLSNVFGINFGGLVSSIAYWGFILGLVLTFANLHDQFLYIGMWCYGAINLIDLLQGLFTKYPVFGWGYVFRIAIYGGLGYLVFKRTVTGASSSKGINA